MYHSTSTPYKELQHLWILGSAGGLGTHPAGYQGMTYYIKKQSWWQGSFFNFITKNGKDDAGKVNKESRFKCPVFQSCYTLAEFTEAITLHLEFIPLSSTTAALRGRNMTPGPEIPTE